MAEVNHVDRRNFDKNLGNIAPYRPADFAFDPNDETYYSLHIHLTYAFQWDREVVGEDLEFEGASYIQPTGWGYEFGDYV